VAFFGSPDCAVPNIPLGTPFDPAQHWQMANKPQKKKQQPHAAVILGVGMDSDGKKRITTGPNFALVGGTEETHQEMTEKVIKINEKIAAKGKPLADISREELDDIASSVGLQRQPRPRDN
jgi:hypothetical protein